MDIDILIVVRYLYSTPTHVILTVSQLKNKIQSFLNMPKSDVFAQSTYNMNIEINEQHFLINEQ